MTIYKEMEYQSRLYEAEKLAEGEVGEYKWLVLSLGSHPCGYVSIPENHPFYGKKYWDIEDKIEAHGGLTFSGKLRDIEGLWFGWDYAHAGDFTFPFVMTGDKLWTTQKIVDECLNVIKQFQKYEKAKVQANFKLTHQGKIPFDQFKLGQEFLAIKNKNEDHRHLLVIEEGLYDSLSRDLVNNVEWYAWEPINVVAEIKKEKK